MNEALQGLNERGVGNIALMLVELAARKQATRRNEHLVQFVDDRRLADARISGHQYELRNTGGNDTFKCGEQCLAFAVAAVKLFGNKQSIGSIVGASRERIDPSRRLPRHQAPAQIDLDPGGGLIALLWGLREHS